MGQFGAFDLELVVALAFLGVMLVCIMFLYAIRDRQSFPPRIVSRTLQCPRHNRQATVSFVERMVTGMLDRRVRECSIRKPGEHCGESCCNQMV
jgi:hypothetical protein